MSNFPLSVEEFVDRLRSPARAARDGTIRHYARVVRRAMAAGDLAAPLREAQSRSAWLVAYSALVAYAEEAGLVDVRAELKRVPPPRKPPKETRPVREDVWRRVIEETETIGDPERSAMLLILLSGLRIGDVLGLSRATVGRLVQHGEADIAQKGGHERLWAPPEDVLDPLRRLLDTPGWSIVGEVFAKNPSTAQDRVRKLLAAICRSAGVEYANPHRFRHAMATALDEAGEHIKTIQAVLGHASPQTTMRYIHVSGKRQAAAAGSVIRRVRGGSVT